MDLSSRQKIVSRIISGKISDNFVLNGIDREIVFVSPSRQQNDRANEIYHQVLADGYCLGAYSSSEVLPLINWRSSDQDRYDKVVSDITEMKVIVYKSFFDITKKEAVRTNIRNAEERLRQLYRQKNMYETYTCEGVAKICKMRYLISQSVCVDGKPLFGSGNYWSLVDYDNILDYMIGLYSNNIIDETSYRTVARTDPWRSIWNMKSSTGDVFGVPSVDLTEEQRTLSIWSTMYDNINESTERPPQEIIDDDDSIDGWMIVQGREREEENKQSGMKTLGLDDKTGREVFIPANTAKDAQKINDMNSVQSKGEKKERDAFVKSRGSVSEKDLPETRRTLTRQMIQMQKDRK